MKIEFRSSVQSTQLELFELLPGDTITTTSGTAVVTRTDWAGQEMIIFADYGSGIDQPHIREGIQSYSLGERLLPDRGRRPLERDDRVQVDHALYGSLSWQVVGLLDAAGLVCDAEEVVRVECYSI